MKIRGRPSPTEVTRAIQTALDDCRAGEWRRSVRLLRDLIAYVPDNFDAQHLLGQALVMGGRIEDGIQSLEKATRLRPEMMAAWLNLGLAHNAIGRRESAIDALERARSLQPDNVEVASHTSYVLLALGRTDEALERASRFAAQHGSGEASWRMLGMVQLEARRPEDARESFRKAVAVDAESMMALRALGLVNMMLSSFDEALPVLEKVALQRPSDIDVSLALATAKRQLCCWSGIDDIEQRVVSELRRSATSVVPLPLINVTDDPALLHENVKRRARAMPERPMAAKPAAPLQGRRLRVGYLSADFRDHPVGHLIHDVIAAHDRTKIEAVGIAYGTEDNSDTRAALARAFERFVDLADASPFEMAKAISELDVDILVELTGLTDIGRPETLSLRPARVQVSWLGYPGTSGLAFMDYILADPVVIPSASAEYFTERVVWLPDTYMPTTRWQLGAIQPRTAYGLPDDGFVFCALNAVQKITPQMFSIWMRLLVDTPGSVLWLRSTSRAVIENLRERARGHNVEPDRLVFAGHVATREAHLSRFKAADLFLDTSPYGAHTTACEAIWAGLPVVTLLGRSFAGRVGASLNTTVGLAELIASSPEEYETIAKRLAHDKGGLANVRQRLAANLASTALFDAPRLARNLERAYYQMHETAAKGEVPRSFRVIP